MVLYDRTLWHPGSAAVALLAQAILPVGIALTTPDSKVRTWFVLPVCMGLLLWHSLYNTAEVANTDWGQGCQMITRILRAFELVVLYQAEKYHWRVTPVLKEDKIMYAPEQVPEPWTWAKLDWAWSLWWNQRGIGWNFQPPLPASCFAHPFTPLSSRRQYLLNRLFHLGRLLVIDDIVTSIIASPTHNAFFSGKPYGSDSLASLASLPIHLRALYSICVVGKILTGTDIPTTIFNILCVGIGGLFGLRGEWFEPWGHPPMFGTLGEMWVQPGLGVLWGKHWHHLFRRSLYAVFWKGLGEDVLGLSPSRATPAVSPPSSGLTTPIDIDKLSDPQNTDQAHVVPPVATHAIPPPAPRSQVMANLIKSLLVFTATGLFHEFAGFVVTPGHAPALTRPAPHPGLRFGATTLFFAVQPLGIALESLLKKRWRAYKNVHNLGDAQRLARFERIVGFMLVWWWLGWTAGWVVEEWSKLGLFAVDPSIPRWSLTTPFWHSAISLAKSHSA